HTILLLSRPLRWSYRRSTVTIFGNVVHATHGESKAEVLGSGDATVPNQTFTLKSSPVTYVSAPTPSGAATTLEVRVDEVRWPQRPFMSVLGPDDRGYRERRDDAHATSVIGGNGRWGRRFPTGVENIRARYRVGIGR